LPPEVLIQLAGDVVELRGRPEDAGAQRSRQTGEDNVVIFDLERNANQPTWGGRDQERSKRAVDRAVGHVQQPFPLGLCDQAGM